MCVSSQDQREREAVSVQQSLGAMKVPAVHMAHRPQTGRTVGFTGSWHLPSASCIGLNSGCFGQSHNSEHKKLPCAQPTNLVSPRHEISPSPPSLSPSPPPSRNKKHKRKTHQNTSTPDTPASGLTPTEQDWLGHKSVWNYAHKIYNRDILITTNRSCTRRHTLLVPLPPCPRNTEEWEKKMQSSPL